MALKYTSRVWTLTFGLGFGMWGCSANDAATLAPADRASGQIHLPLVTPDDGAFRLRQASFTIDDSAGNLVLTLDSDADPDATSLDAELGQAAYSIELLDGWSLEQLAEDGSSTAVAAALLTTNPTDFEIHDGGVTNILYQFATNSGVVSFGAGTLDIGVDVTTQAGLPGCDLLDRNSCPSGQSCLLRDGSGETFCADSGSLPIGSPCSSDQCVAGSQCLAIEGSTERVCTRFCNPASTFCGCRSLSTDENVGVCDPSLPITPARFQHDFSDGSSGFGSLACEEWSAFRDTLNGGVFGRVVIESSTGNSIECNEPALADQICGALGARSSTQVFCEGHTWNVGICEDSEITVDSSICNCTFSPTVRPCDDSYGGFGTFTCSNVPQVLAVLCE